MGGGGVEREEGLPKSKMTELGKLQKWTLMEGAGREGNVDPLPHRIIWTIFNVGEKHLF